MRYLISGGGTGGHIFPAVSIANALCELDKDAKILFVGALGRMEMERVPEAGYEIVGLPVSGFNRSKPWKNVSVLIDLARSLRQAKRIVRDFRPDVAIGVGGYASGAAMKAAAWAHVPVLLQEQNGFAGVTNKLLRNDAAKICVAYDNMERFFPADKIILTGNPVRANLTQGSPEKACAYFNGQFGVRFTEDTPTLLIIGGSLGARTINESILQGLDKLLAAGIQIVWQTGKMYYEKCAQEAARFLQSDNGRLVVTAFLNNMPDAYALADVVISRAGASSISELCLLGKASILVPSPNVAEDHQTHNAMALVKQNAAVLVKDTEAPLRLVPTTLRLLENKEQCAALRRHILTLAQPDSARRIAEEVLRLVPRTRNP
ncbi:MAG: undecaprenyldiphospho-muramoylpentapeptide beta-N-acetylglucosaminyltransferase [Paludibacteraceae bacterium]|nr:undecaprenyldiphospho-muramoylpentapeptide beta-N-acetylglucosaminyltransferase [Paludibacteraceae bacterium]